ncbi:hypothetical protein [Streptomyces sp. CRN 30]|uniref:hypothetical protein n=1 Tax=Streptomyces sp. CRN 30 TaxID=3075613 RepID=UPI002A8006F3|nr:hypothetical protein [Streptomyces sp. CRN 30]
MLSPGDGMEPIGALGAAPACAGTAASFSTCCRPGDVLRWVPDDGAVEEQGGDELTLLIGV